MTHTPGLRALIRANQLEGAEITAYHVGFVLGPCINASGRLDTAARSLELLCERDEEKAAKLAGDLVALNQSRKAMTEEGKRRCHSSDRRNRIEPGSCACGISSGLP